MANLELDVPMKSNMIFEIASITKQFTAISLLMLMEQNNLSLDDDITKYVEGYLTHGHKMTIHHLLTYTSMREWSNEWREEVKPKEFAEKPPAI